MGKLLAILLVIAGIAAGVGAGLALRPSQEPVECGGPEQPDCPEPQAEAEIPEGEDPAFDYVRLDNPFVIPVVQDGSVRALVVLSLAVEVAPGATDMVLLSEPKLRDALLRVLFDHAHGGGFEGAFTLSGNLDTLERALREAAQSAVGSEVNDVLIQSILRQDS